MSKQTLFLVSAAYFLVNGAVQSSAIFIPLLGASLGGSSLHIGLLGASYGAAFLLASLYSGQKSDQRGKLHFIRLGLLMCTIAFAAQLLAVNLVALTAARAFVGLSLGVTAAAVVAYAFESGLDMGKFSSFSSLGWIGGSATATLITDIHMLFLASSIFCAVAFAMSIFLPRPATEVSIPVGHKPNLVEVLKRGRTVYLSVFLRHLGATSVFIILPLYLASLGVSNSWIAALWMINFVVQFFVMRILERFDPAKVFAVGQVLSIIVFLGYGLAHSLQPLLFIQVVLGAAWACLYVGALLLVLRIGREPGTASGLFTATLNLCNAIGPLLGGIIAQYYGYRGVMFFAAAIGVGGMIVAVPKRHSEPSPARDYVDIEQADS